MKIKVEVTQTHIVNGDPKSAKYCPIALAVRGLVKSQHARTVRIRSRNLQFTRMIRRFRLPQSARRFMARFDHFKPVKPTRFVLDIPKSYLKVQYL